MSAWFTTLKHYKTKYKGWASPIAFTCGFILDLFTLNQIDQRFDLTILLVHLGLATFWMSLWHIQRSPIKLFKKWKKRKKFFKRIAPAAMQFSFGALFSGFVIFYTKSSSLLISWPFLIILYFLFLGNETFRKFYQGLFFQIGVLYFSILTMSIFLVPLGMKDIGSDIFILSGLISLLIIGLILRFMARELYSISSMDHKRLWLWIGMIWMAVNVLYYEKLIPAIPLSLKDDGLYYHIERKDADSYLAFAPVEDFWKRILPPDQIAKPEEEWIYYYSAIYAPKHFKQKIIHHWEYFDPRTERWVRAFQQTLKIEGGRQGGYRGYSYLIDPPIGKWRILSKTSGGQVLGQKKFEIIEALEPPAMEVVEL